MHPITSPWSHESRSALVLQYIVQQLLQGLVLLAFAFFFCFCVFCQFQRCLLQRSLHSIVRVSAPSEERELCTVVHTRFRPLKISLNDSLGARMRPPVDVCLESAGGRSRRVLRAGLGLGSGFNPNSLSLV